MQWCLLVLLPGQYGVGSVLDEERGRESVSPHDGQVKETVPRGVSKVKVTAVADQCVGNALITTKQGKVEGDVPFTIKFVKLLRQLQWLDAGHSYSVHINIIRLGRRPEQDVHVHCIRKMSYLGVGVVDSDFVMYTMYMHVHENGLWAS